jgi:hypothetical protein
VIPDIKSLEGTIIEAVIPSLFNESNLQTIRLLRVEDNGLWIESPAIMETAMADTYSTMSPRSPMFFVPWSQLFYIIASNDVPALSERLLHV